MDLETAKKELHRILNIEDYDDDTDAIEDGASLCEIAWIFEKEIERLTAKCEALEAGLQRIIAMDNGQPHSRQRTMTDIARAALADKQD